MNLEVSRYFIQVISTKSRLVRLGVLLREEITPNRESRPLYSTVWDPL